MFVFERFNFHFYLLPSSEKTWKFKDPQNFASASRFFRTWNGRYSPVDRHLSAQKRNPAEIVVGFLKLDSCMFQTNFFTALFCQVINIDEVANLYKSVGGIGDEIFLLFSAENM
jgi:hypothetical protein